MSKSVEEQVEFYYKNLFSNLGIRIYGKIEPINKDIDEALKSANSKSGGSGNNYPDIKFILKNDYNRYIPVIVEAKGSKGKLEKLDSDGFIEQVVRKNDIDNYKSITNYAVNGALHYGLALLNSDNIYEVIIIGINGTTLNNNGTIKDPEFKAYYVSKNNNKIPKLLTIDNNFIQFKSNNINSFFKYLDTLSLTEEEIQQNKEKIENELDKKIQKIHQKLYEDPRLKNPLLTNEKLYLFCGLIMAGLKIPGIKPLDYSELSSNDDEYNNDGIEILKRIKSFLNKKDTSKNKYEKIITLFESTLKKDVLWKPYNGISIIKEVYSQIQEDIIPLLESDWHLDFTGKILNRLSDWVSIDNDKSLKDVVLTPRYITNFMARLTRINKDSYVWDKAMGSGGFLVSAMDIMISDAKSSIHDKEKLEEKINHIKKEQLLGVEILENIYILAVLNMILMGDGSSKIINDDSHKYLKEYETFPADVLLLNPPYSAPGKGLNFVEETLEQMNKGYACVLIQDTAGTGKGLPYSKRILKKNTLLASINMPLYLFETKAMVKTNIYLFQVGRPHELDDLVTFIDMSDDGYIRQHRKKSSQNITCKDVNDANGRYNEVVAKILGKDSKTNYYNEDNGLLIKDTISLNGNDWTFSKHKKINPIPKTEDFKLVISEYLAYKISQYLQEGK